MMHRSMHTTILLAVAAAGFVIALQSHRLSNATRERSAAAAAVQDIARQAQEVVDLRATRQTIESRQRPAQDVIAQVNAVLAEVGIPGQQLKSLTPESEASAPSSNTGGGSRLMQQSLRLVLEGLTPRQIGAFLLQWRASQDIWTPTRIELTHNRVAGQSTGAEGNRYDAAILLAALYVADSALASVRSEQTQPMALVFMEERQ